MGGSKSGRSQSDSEGGRPVGHTETSSFGSSGRFSHDSSRFYDSRLYADQRAELDLEFIENPVPDRYLDRVLCKSSEQMAELPDHSVHLMVTSPPYNVSKEYDQDLTLGEYRDLIRQVLSETYRVLVTGGRACVNLANLGRKPYIPLHAFLISDLLDIGFRMRGEIIWDKAGSAASSTAWGSWMSASNPVLRDVHEYILVFSKDSFKRPASGAGEESSDGQVDDDPEAAGSKQSPGRKSTIERDEFLAWTKSIWRIPSASAKQIGHPAPFPEELPERLIKLYSYQGDVVLDPFAGAGTTCVAALKNRRRYVAYEIEPEYVRIAEARIAEAAAA